MKFKASAIALAVAGTIAAPMAVQAEGSIYASARVGIHSIDNTDSAGVSSDDNISISSYSSRFGMKGETDLGNGMTGFGKYEFSVGDGATLGGGRHHIVGLKGSFGKVTLGKTYFPFYNHVVGPLDTPWAGSGYAMIGYTGRTGNTISWDSAAGAVSFGVGVQMGAIANDEDIDAIEAGLTLPLGDMNLGLGFRDSAEGSVGGVDPDAIIAVALSGIALGSVGLGVSFQSQDSDFSYVVDATMGGFYFHYEATDIDAAGAADPTLITVGYTQSLGRNTTAWYEIAEHDGETGLDADDFTNVRAVLKYDIL